MEIGKWVDRRQRRRRRSSSCLPWCSCCVFVGLLALFQEYAFVDKAPLSLSRKPRRLRVACGQQAPDSLSSRSELYQLLQQREHVLRRPDMYIGPVEPRNETAWIVKGRKIVESSLLLSPGLVQIYNEILVNAIDRQFHSSLSEIRITVNRKEISIWNDGGAIPIEIHELSGLFVPSMVFGEFMSGENFNDTGIRFTGGRNGIGAKATNVFSQSFEVTVDDPTSHQRFYQRWEENMATVFEPEISPLPPEIERGSVKVTFKPDLRQFGLTSINKEHIEMMKARAFDAAASTTSDVRVSFNDVNLTVQDFQEFSRMALGENFAVAAVHDSKGRLRAEVSVAFAGSDGFGALGLVNGIRCSRGTHVKHVTDQITSKVAEMVANRRGPSYRPSDATVKQYLRIIVKILVDNPDFDSQTKTRLTTTSHKLGFDFVLPEEFFEQVAELGVLDASIKAMEATRNRVMQRALSSGAPPSIAKLEDAVNAGKKGHSCTLILTEGDSAKALAVAGLAKVGRENYGVFPLKGKLLNVRGASDQQIQSNVEIKHLMYILGLRWGQTFQSEEEVAALRYQHVMIFSDQDLDGHHIAGLVINLLASLWPSLLEVKPDFLERFATPLVKVFPSSSSSSGPRVDFFTQGEFDTWQKETGADWTKRYRAKYYKGLGTSTREEALQYFSDMEKHVIDVEFSGEDDLEAVAKAFEPSRTDDRKTWIEGYDPSEELNYNQESASFVDFFDKSFVHFSAHDCVRSIPRLLDGLKPSQRKVLWWAMRNLKSEKKVSQIVGLVSSATSYHHGEVSLVKVIVNLAQDFVGTNNLNLFQPIGMFGTRLNGRDVHASARYINTKLSQLVPYIFRKEDFDLVPPQLEEGHEIEPRTLLPIFPLVLVNGFTGIGTGWSTNGPNFDVIQVVDCLMALIKRSSWEATLMPSFRGHRGTVQDLNGRWVSYGNWQILEGKDIDEGLLLVEITELPVKVWTDDYIADLEKKATKQRVAMKLFKCSNHDDQNVHLLLAFDRDQFDSPEQAMHRFLRLQKSITSHMWLFTEAEDHSTSLEFFQEPLGVLTAFYRARRPFYEQRKERMMQRMSHKVRLLENQVRCIEMHLEGELDPTSCFLQEQGFDRMLSNTWSPRDEKELEGDEGFKYLLEMPIHRFSTTGAKTSQERLREAQEDLDKVKQLDIDDMWLQDLQAFRDQYLKVDGKAAIPPVKLSKSDRQKALKIFNQERRRWTYRDEGPEEVFSLSLLGKLSMSELKDRADEVGLDLRSSKKRQDLIDSLLSYQSIGYNEKNWEKLTAMDLKAHLQLRGLSQVGNRQSLVERLSGSQTGYVAFRQPKKKMQEEFRYMGLSTFGSVVEREQRYTILRRRQIEEEVALRNLPRDELKQLHPKAFREEVFSRLSRCFTIARCEDLPQAKTWTKMNKLRKEEKCWVDCIKSARTALREEGAVERQASPKLFRQVVKCFQRRKECDDPTD